MAEQDYPRRYPMMFSILLAVVRLLAAILIRRLVVEGKENIPAEGGLAVVVNHIDYLDSPILAIVFPRPLYVLAGDTYEKHPFFGPLLRLAGAIFIKRGEVDRRALRQSIAVLRDGHCLGLAIEGTRSKTGGLSRGKSGAAYIVTHADVPILPVVITGTEKILPSLARLKRAEVTVRFGQPFRLPAGHIRSGELDQYTEQIMLTLARMLPEAYRGIYRDHPALRQVATVGGGSSESG